MDDVFLDYPNLLLKPFKDLDELVGDTPAKEHKSLIDLGESQLIYIAGILFGEYKKKEVVNKAIEKALYQRNGRNLSLGHFQGFVRMLFKEMDHSLIHKQFEKTDDFDEAKQFVFAFSVLKKVIDEGANSNFEEKVVKKSKGMSAKKMGLLDFYNSFIQLRNIYAHPKGKAGSKSNERDWPLTDEYFEFINEPLNAALQEVLENIKVVSEYPCIRASDQIYDDKRKAKFYLEKNLTEDEIELELSENQIKYLTSGQRFLLDPDKNIFSKLFYGDIPNVDKSIVKEIQKEEKAKQITPHLIQMIRDKLSDDGRIDNLEYLVIKDTAQTGHISEEKLFQLIGQIKSELNLDVTVGSPEKPGEIFIDQKEEKKSLSFNPWWLHYFSLVSTVDDDKVKEEKDRIERLDSRIDSRKEDLKKLLSRIRKKEKLQTKQRKKIRKEKSSVKKRIRDLKKSIKSATTEDREETLSKEIEKREELHEERMERYVEDLTRHENDTQELEERFKNDKEIYNQEIKDIQRQRDTEYRLSTWGRHRYLWEEIHQYVSSLLDENLNNEEADSEISEDEESELWMNSSNTYQIGNLAYYYWGKIRPARANLDDLFHIGLWVGKEFKWVPTNVLNDTLKEDIGKPSFVLWTSVYDDRLEKVDSDKILLKKYRHIIRDFIHTNSQALSSLNLNVVCIDLEYIEENGIDPDEIENTQYATDAKVFMTLNQFLEEKNKYEIIGLYSSIWNLDNIYEEGRMNLQVIQEFEEQVQTLLGLFSNIIIRINDYAIEEGIDQEYITRKEEQYSRYKSILHEKFKEVKTKKGFNPTEDDIYQWREYAKNSIHITDRLFDMIFDKYRWIANS